MNKNEHYFFFEITGQHPILKTIKKIQDQMVAAHVKACAFAVSVHKKCSPVAFRKDGYEMVGVHRDDGKPLENKAWRKMPSWGKGVMVPHKGRKAGKEAVAAMDALNVPAKPPELGAQIKQFFGAGALKPLLAATGKGLSQWFIEWKWGSYKDAGSKSVIVLQIPRGKNVVKGAPRGMKKIKWSRVEQLSEFTEESS